MPFQPTPNTSSARSHPSCGGTCFSREDDAPFRLNLTRPVGANQLRVTAKELRLATAWLASIRPTASGRRHAAHPSAVAQFLYSIYSKIAFHPALWCGAEMSASGKDNTGAITEFIRRHHEKSSKGDEEALLTNYAPKVDHYDIQRELGKSKARLTWLLSKASARQTEPRFGPAALRKRWPEMQATNRREIALLFVQRIVASNDEIEFSHKFRDASERTAKSQHSSPPTNDGSSNESAGEEPLYVRPPKPGLLILATERNSYRPPVESNACANAKAERARA